MGFHKFPFLAHYCFWYAEIVFQMRPESHFSIIMSSYQFRNSHYKHKIVFWPSYLFYGNPFSWKGVFFIEMGPRLHLENDNNCLVFTEYTMLVSYVKCLYSGGSELRNSIIRLVYGNALFIALISAWESFQWLFVNVYLACLSALSEDHRFCQVE